jgi:hypothetical protein
MVAAGLQYWRASGTEPAAVLRYDPGRKWRDVPPGELYRQGMGFEQEIEPLYQQVCAACPGEADGVLIAGTGFRCVGIVDALEQDLRRPVIAANQASLWHCLRLSGVCTPISGYGNLLRRRSDRRLKLAAPMLEGTGKRQRLLRSNRLDPVHPQHSVTRWRGPDCRVSSNAWPRAARKMGRLHKGAEGRAGARINNDCVVGIAAVAA